MTMISADKFNEEYYKYGVERGIGLYQNFRWIPSHSFPQAVAIRQMFGLRSVLDYGCAFGFVVKALRILGTVAYGYDISKYAISQAPTEIVPFVTNNPDIFYGDVVYIKDVLEHVSEEEMLNTLLHIKSRYYNNCLAVIPLGDNGKFRIPDYEKDTTHITKKDEEYWIKIFYESGQRLIDFTYHISGIKDNWFNLNPYGNGVFIFEKI